MKQLDSELQVDIPLSPNKDMEVPPKALDSPKLRDALIKKPVKRPKVLLPVRRPDPEIQDEHTQQIDIEDKADGEEVQPDLEVLDFETAISTHTVTKPPVERSKLKRRGFPLSKLPFSEDEEWLTVNSDMETRSSFPGSGTPDSKEYKPSLNAASESTEEHKEPMYTYSESE